MRDQGMKKPERVTVERRKANGQVVPYHVVDSAANFRQNDWDRVVCVFVAGQQWQFKGWKWEKPLELFSNGKSRESKRCNATPCHAMPCLMCITLLTSLLYSIVKGIYPKWQTDTLQGAVKDWAVSQMNVRSTSVPSNTSNDISTYNCHRSTGINDTWTKL
jgi:parafibromin